MLYNYSSGNPTSYYNGTRWTFQWENGRELKTATNGTKNISYDYDANGLRTQKTVDGVTHTYYYGNDGKLLRETYDTHILDFFYNPDGTPHALRYNGTYFYYVTNLQGDVIRVVDADGETVCEYQYDPYGNILSKTATEIRIEISSADDDSSDIFEDLKDLMEDMGNIDIPVDGEILELSVDIGHLNPLRYRGYYYDTETGLYYLQSRYYDPAIGRFINADTFASTGQGFIGFNMFAYCGNNPALNLDISGNRYIASTTVQSEMAVDRSIACQHQNKIVQDKSRNGKEAPSQSNSSSKLDIAKLLSAMENNLSFSFAIGQGISFKREIFGMGFDIGAYGNYGSWTYSRGKWVSGQEMYAGITTSLFGQEIGVVYHEFRENGTTVYQNNSWAVFNSEQDSFTIVGEAYYFLFAGFSYNISFNPIGFIVELE